MFTDLAAEEMFRKKRLITNIPKRKKGQGTDKLRIVVKNFFNPTREEELKFMSRASMYNYRKLIYSYINNVPNKKITEAFRTLLDSYKTFLTTNEQQIGTDLLSNDNEKKTVKMEKKSGKTKKEQQEKIVSSYIILTGDKLVKIASNKKELTLVCEVLNSLGVNYTIYKAEKVEL